MKKKLFPFVLIAVFGGANAGVVTGASDDRPFKIISKPTPLGFGQCGQRAGRVVLRVTFHESGKVTEVLLTSPSGCTSWDKQAIKAAKKVKFKPAVKDGVKITVTKNVEYSFTIL